MDPLKISEIVQAVQGSLINCSEEISIIGMTTQVSKVKKGCLFIPYLVSTQAVGNLIEEAYQQGAAAAVVTNQVDCDMPQIIVDNNISAYTKIFMFYRKKFSIPVIGITGSAGKTSTKDMLSLVLGEKFKVCKTQENDNTYAGTIRTVLSMSKEHGAAIFELGFTGLMDSVKYFADISLPNIAVITNISTGHYALVGSRENVMKAKMGITSSFNENSILIINNDDDCLSTIQNKPYRIIKVSTRWAGEYNAFDIVDNGEDGVEFKCGIDGTIHSFKINAPGAHFVYSALICIAVGRLLDVDVELIKKGISKFKPFIYRMNVINLGKNIKLINDCYNANLISMKAAADTLRAFKGTRKIAVLGDILEQGSQSETVHRELGKYITDKCDLLVAVGMDSKYIYEESKSAIKAQYFQTKQEALSYLEGIIMEGDVILIKGSRGMLMEEITIPLVKFVHDMDIK